MGKSIAALGAQCCGCWLLFGGVHASVIDVAGIRQ